MKKNLKKVISAVLSLALAASSFVAMNVSAATFADVADTASYAEAVNALAALGAISGYEDGTFQPNNNITRAEVATMVVAALNMTADAQNSGSTTQFADVNEKAAWAAGYVNVGVAQGYISGMSATEFAPQDNVTYAQILSMLTRILGYGEFAEARGGWPNGYLTAAATAGILSGVSAGANDAVTRAQVAQLIWNAVQAPVLDITTFSTSNTGTEMQKMDGKGGRSFKTPLSDKFDAYVLNVVVEKTSKMDSTSNAGEIEMKLTNSNDWDPEMEMLVSSIENDTDKLKSEVKAGETDVESYPFSSAKVVATYIDDEWELVYFAPTTKVAQKAVDGTLVKSLTADQLSIKKSKTTTNATNYKLDNAVVYVNGVEFKAVKGNETVIENLLKYSDGETILVEGEKSGYYTRIMVDYSIVARINQVAPKSDSTDIILAGPRFPGSVVSASNAGTTIKINNDDVEDGTVSLVVVKNGQAADLAALAKDDVVAIKYNINDKITESAFIEIYATTDVVTGKFYSYDDEEKLYTIGEAEYETVGYEEIAYDEETNPKGIENGTSYTFKLDPYGRIYDYEVEAETKNFAIVERYIDIDKAENSSSEYSYMQVMTLDGQSKTLYVETEADSDITALMEKMGITTSVNGTAKAVDIEDRIIEYTVKASTGRVREAEQVKDLYVFNSDEEKDKDAEFNSATNRLGKTLASNAVVLDATDYTSAVTDKEDKASISDYQASSLAGLSDGVKYEGVLVYKNNSNEYMYVIITKAGATFGADSNFAVAATRFSASSSAIVNDEDVYTLDVMENGSSEASKLNLSKNVKVYKNGDEVDKTEIKAGTVFFYTTDSDGFVNKVAIVFAAPTEYKNLYEVTTAEAGYVTKPVITSDSIIDADWIISANDKDFSAEANDEIQLVFAPVVTANTKSVTVADIKKDSDKYYVDTDTTYNFSVSDDTKVYSYDMSGNVTGKAAFSAGAFSGIELRDTDAGKAWLTGATGDQFDFSYTIQMAFMMVVDGTVTNALVFAN